MPDQDFMWYGCLHAKIQTCPVRQDHLVISTKDAEQTLLDPFVVAWTVIRGLDKEASSHGQGTMVPAIAGCPALHCHLTA